MANETILLAVQAIVSARLINILIGYSDPQQIFSLLPLFESGGVDFLVLHPRTVLQEYKGLADHGITTRVVQETGLPVIANGDVRTVEDGLRVLEQTKAAGLMLGRGAIADPLLFQRLRAGRPDQPERAARAAMLRHYLAGLLERYQGIFCGEQQILGKVKSVFATMDDPDFAKQIKGLKKARTIRQFADLVVQLT
ncbi:tRNA-dihydrouridine synthase family protein [Trichlorobacter lovleyi]|uniref:tRNA-dihydrouridine synthase family protein n=1 Tax=Trichlorobacter lovleyi TaxID=313985 RepID=UPI0006745989|nr:tRNA-dihydrouridine synthase family protein [Trichlorobacter lovleyi]